LTLPMLDAIALGTGIVPASFTCIRPRPVIEQTMNFA
jgi:hypothetical protein